MNNTIYDEIKRRILFFQYEPGQMLNEKKLSEEFGVSRTPVREIFLKLEWEKLVTIMPRAGIMVTKVDFQELHDVYQVRLNLSYTLGKMAATRITEQQIDEMKRLRDECLELTDTSDYRRLVGIDLRLRKIISTAANNKSLAEITDYLYNQTQRFWFMVFNKVDFNLLINDEVKEIEEGIKVFTERDPEKAGEYRRRMIEQSMEQIVRMFGY